MNRTRTLVIAALALAGAWGTAQARDRAEVQWSVAIPGPVSVVVGNAAPRWLPPVPVPRIVYEAPYYPAHGYGYGHGHGHGRGYGDRDRDGIPNRHDRVYNPHWDRDGDGIPNRYDRHPYHPDQRGYDRRDDHRDHRDDRWDDRRGPGRGR